MRFSLALGFSVVLGVCPVWGQQTVSPPPSGSADRYVPPPQFYVPYGRSYGYMTGPYYSHDRQRAQFDYRTGRRTERYRQNAFEVQRDLNARLQQRGLPPQQYLPPPIAAHGQGSVYYGDYANPWDRYWRYGREMEYYRQQELYAREETTRLVHRDFLAQGIKEFRAGRYGEAARSFMAAADKNHADAASRLHAGQALVAVGMYDQALEYFRRAFELQPKLMNMPLNLQTDYASKADYTNHVAKLEAHCKTNQKDGRAWLLLAVEHFFGPNPPQAARAFEKAKKLLANDYLTQLLVRTAEPVLRAAPDASAGSNEKT